MNIQSFIRAQELSRLAVITRNSRVWEEAMQNLRRAAQWH